MRTAPLCITMAVVLASAADVAHAQPAMPLRVRVDVSDGVIAQRVQGQLADLEIALAFADLACDAPLEARITYADPGVDVIACVRQTQRAILVEVIDVRARRAFVRRFAGGTASARAEEAAVTLRSTLDALRLGGELGIALPPPPAPPPAPPAIVAETPRADGSDPSLHVVIGATSTADGLEAGFPIAPSARVGYAHRRFEIGVVGSVGLERRRAFPDATVLLTRHVAILSVGYALVDASHVRLVAGAGLGLALRARTTTHEGPGFMVTPSSRALEGLGYVGLRLALFPKAHGAFGFELGAGAEAPFSRTRLVVQSGDARSTLDSVLPVLPRFELGFIVRTRP